MTSLTPASKTQPCTLDGFHGGPLRKDGFALFIAIGTGARSLALSYAEDHEGAPQVQHLSYECLAPLVLETGEQVKEMWEASGALTGDGGFHHHSDPCASRRLADWAREQGYDSIIALPESFHDEIGYEWAVGTFGEPQAILLEPARAAVLPR